LQTRLPFHYNLFLYALLTTSTHLCVYTHIQLVSFAFLSLPFFLCDQEKDCENKEKSFFVSLQKKEEKNIHIYLFFLTLFFIQGFQFFKQLTRNHWNSMGTTQLPINKYTVNLLSPHALQSVCNDHDDDPYGSKEITQWK